MENMEVYSCYRPLVSKRQKKINHYWYRKEIHDCRKAFDLFSEFPLFHMWLDMEELRNEIAIVAKHYVASRNASVSKKCLTTFSFEYFSSQGNFASLTPQLPNERSGHF